MNAIGKVSEISVSGYRIPARVSRISVLFLFLVCESLGLAQLDTGTISGTVTDQSGGAVPGATVTIRNVETGVARNLTTNATGRYEAAALPVGNYEVRASLTGFQTLVRSGINLTVGRNAVVNMALQVVSLPDTMAAIPYFPPPMPLIPPALNPLLQTPRSVFSIAQERRVFQSPSTLSFTPSSMVISSGQSL